MQRVAGRDSVAATRSRSVAGNPALEDGRHAPLRIPLQVNAESAEVEGGFQPDPP